MLLTLVIILILIWAAVVGSLYSNFLVFYQNFTETENYHKARYAAIAATERAELVIRQREPWYVWSWWWIRSENTWWSPSDRMPAWTWFSYFSEDASSKSTIFWKINSRAKRIPATWNGNTEKLLSAEDSPNYNMMDYENAEVFLLYYDNLEDGPYDKKDCSSQNDCRQTELKWIKVALRLPPYVRDKFGDLDASKPLMQEWYKDDAIVDWQIRWSFFTGGLSYPFTIFATQDAFWAWTWERDSAIRESFLNNSGLQTVEFSKQRNPITTSSTSPTIISRQDAAISWRSKAFEGIFTNVTNNIDDNHYKSLQLRLSLLNLALWWWEPWKRYPYLEYYVQFIPQNSSTPTIASDKYFTIETEWNFWDYKINNVLYKPTITESILRSFTTIF